MTYKSHGKITASCLRPQQKAKSTKAKDKVSSSLMCKKMRLVHTALYLSRFERSHHTGEMADDSEEEDNLLSFNSETESDEDNWAGRGIPSVAADASEAHKAPKVL